MNFIRNNTIVTTIATGAIAAFIVTRAIKSDAEYEYPTPSINATCWFKSTYPLGALIAGGADVNVVSTDGSTALHEVCWRRSPLKIFSALIAAGADVNVQNNNGYTPLYVAVANSVPLDHIKLLINAGADVNIPDNEGWTPLHIMCNRRESLETIKLLLSAGANVNAQTIVGNSSLHFACRRRDMRVAQTLLDAGADPTIKNVEGRFPHEMAVMKEFKELFEQFGGGRATKAAQ